MLGLFELRNCIEAAALAAPTVGLCTLVAQHTPFSLTVKLILSLCLLRAGLRLCTGRHSGRAAVAVSLSPISAGGKTAASH